MHGVAVWIKKIFTAWRSENAVKTNKGARDLSRAARPENKVDICENGKEHEWVETGGSIEHSANHLSVLYFTHYKCKHCPATKSVLDEVHDH